MMDDPKMYVHEIVGSDGKKISAITVFPSYGWVALGTYFNKTGGLDTLKNNAVTKLTLFAALDGFPCPCGVIKRAQTDRPLAPSLNYGVLCHAIGVEKACIHAALRTR